MNFLCSISAIVMYLIIQNYINNYRPFCVFLWCLMVLHFCGVMANESSKVFFAAKKKRFLHGLPPNVNAVEIGISYVAMCTERLFLLSTNACFINKTFSKTQFYCWCKIIKLLSSACLKWLLIFGRPSDIGVLCGKISQSINKSVNHRDIIEHLPYLSTTNWIYFFRNYRANCDELWQH